MQVETLRDVLDWTGEFHRHLTECMADGADSTKNARSQLLLQYLSEHENKLGHVVHEFEKTGSEDALNTWCYEYLDKHPIIHHHYCDAPFSKLSPSEIMEVIIHQHKQVIDLYGYLRERADIPSAQELMESLRSLEEHEIMVMAQSANRLDDI